MPHTFLRATERHLDAERRDAEGTCPECGATALAEYRVLSDGGWFDVLKCRSCLASVRRTPAPPLGSYEPLGLQIARNVG